jgi:hypothetical protein
MFACKIESLFASQNGFSYFLTILLKAFINQSSFEPIVFQFLIIQTKSCLSLSFLQLYKEVLCLASVGHNFVTPLRNLLLGICGAFDAPRI